MIVTVSVPASVVMLTVPLPTSVRVSLLLSATMSLCPPTAMFLKIFCAEPLSVFVTENVRSYGSPELPGVVSVKSILISAPEPVPSANFT